MASREEQMGQETRPAYRWTLSGFWCGDLERRLMLLLPVLCPLFLGKQCQLIRCPFVKGVGTEQPQGAWSVLHRLKISTQIGISTPNATSSSHGFMLGDRVRLRLLPLDSGVGDFQPSQTRKEEGHVFVHRVLRSLQPWILSCLSHVKMSSMN